MIVHYAEKYADQLAPSLDSQNRKKFENEYFVKLLSVDDKGRVLGWTILEESADRLLIDWIFVREEHRRSGVGSELMDRIKGYGRERGLRGISVNTGSKTDWARGFYEKHGFTEVGRVKEFFAFDPEHVFYWFPL